jgi:predicted nucleic acid-binding protein
MVVTKGILVVLDAGPLIHLDELHCLHLLEGFNALLIPSVVWREATHHRPGLKLENIPSAKISDPLGPSPLPLVTASFANELHAGEIAAITLLYEAGGGMLLSDDDAARQTAESLGFPVTGTLGLLLRGIRRGKISSRDVRSLIANFPQHCTLHISRTLLKRFSASIPTDSD